MKLAGLIVISLLFPLGLAAQGTQYVTYRLAQPDSIFGVRTIVDEKGSAQILVRGLDKPIPDEMIKGYRVCIFMEKNQSARESAFAAEARFKAQFPDVATYVLYDKSSYWKVLAGNCLTIDEVTILKGRAESFFPGKPFIVQEDIPLSEFGKAGEGIASSEYRNKAKAAESPGEVATSPDYTF